MTAVHTNPVPRPKHGTAVVDWAPRLCGSTAWGGHLRGADRGIELLSFSKSGRPLASWESAFPWEARRIADAADILNDYDRVILADVACFAPDVTLNDAGRPYYEGVMARVTNKWTAVFHGGTYPTKHDATIDAVLSSPGFCGTLLTPRIGQATARLAPWPSLRFKHHPYLPYDFAHAPARRGTRGRTHDVMMTARIMVNKGQNAALLLAKHLRGDTHIWGYNPYGIPSCAWGLWELATKGFGYASVLEPVPANGKVTTNPNVKKFHTGRFEVATPSNRRYTFHEGYRTLDEVDWSPWVHLTLASPDFAGILEYTILDAVFAGAVVAVPASFPTEGRYETVVTFPFEGSTIAWDEKKGRVRDTKPFDVGAVARVVNGLLKMNNAQLGVLADAQFEEFTRLHRPERTLEAVDRALNKGDTPMKGQTPLTFTKAPPPPGRPPTPVAPRPAAQPTAPAPAPSTTLPDRAPGEGSGAYIRRLLVLGAASDAILARVHAQFPGSKAGPSDVAYNKNKLKKEAESAAAPSPIPTIVEAKPPKAKRHENGSYTFTHQGLPAGTHTASAPFPVTTLLPADTPPQLPWLSVEVETPQTQLSHALATLRLQINKAPNATTAALLHLALDAIERL